MENKTADIKEYYRIYRLKNRDKIREYDKNYKLNNKEKIKESGKRYRDKNRDKTKEYREINKDKIREYIENNRDKFRGYFKKYSSKKKNRNIINLRLKNYYSNNEEARFKKNARAITSHIKIPKNKLCEICLKNIAIEKHHTDYNKPLEIKLLCESTTPFE